MYKQLAFFSFLALTLASISPSEGKKRRCGRLKVYQPPAEGEVEGTCVKCPPCPLGQEPDTKASRNNSQALGYLECYTCSPCKDNYYRDSNSWSKCSPCRRDCASGHRVIGSSCGGASSGSCGDCFPGFVPSDTSNNESFCIPDPVSQESIVIVASDEINERVNKPDEGPADPTPIYETHHHGLAAEGIIAIVCSTIASAALLLAVSGYVYRFLKKNRQANTDGKTYQSDVKLLKSCSSDGSSLETDGPTVVRGEIEGVDANTYFGALQPQPRGDTATSLLNTRYDPIGHSRPRMPALPEEAGNVRLTKNSKELDLVASSISGPRVVDVYRDLGIKKATFEPDKDLWMANRQSHKTYVLNVLLEWLKQDGDKATLDRLYKAVCSNGFHDATSKLDKYMILNKPKCRPDNGDVEKGLSVERSAPNLDLTEVFDDT